MTTMTIDSDARTPEVPHVEGDTANLIYRLEGELRNTSPLSVCSEGLRFVSAVDAEIVAGPLAGSHLSGFDRFTMRTDGSGSIVAPETIETGGASISVQFRGYVVPNGPLELRWPLVSTSHGYDLPDHDFGITGTALIRTDDPRYALLDRAVASITGWVNFESGELEIEARAN